jgi:hypothetical protein
VGQSEANELSEIVKLNSGGQCIGEKKRLETFQFNGYLTQITTRKLLCSSSASSSFKI